MISWRWVRRTLAVVAVGLLIRTVWLVGDREWRRAEGERAVAEAFAETEKVDPGWGWDALSVARPRPPAGRNSADVIAGIKPLLPPDFGAKLHGERWRAAHDLPANVRYPDGMMAEAARELDRAGPAVDLARTLKEFPAPGFRPLVLAPDVVGTRLDDTQRTRAVADLLRWAAVREADGGNPGPAADDLLAMLNASRSIGDEPLLISQLVRLACRSVAARATERVLGQTVLADGRLADLQAAWAADAQEPLLLYGVRGDRAAFDVLLRNMAEGSLPPDAAPGGIDGALGDYGRWLWRVRLLRDRAQLHSYMTAAVAVARLPIHDQPAALAAGLPEPDDDLILARLLMPAVEKVARSTWRNTAESRCVVVGLACERFRLKNSRWPTDLAELPKDLLAAVPLDPFDGKPLRFRRLADGVVVYSIGENRADDGGTLPRSNTDRPDEGFRLWDPVARRQPAPPGPPDEPAPEDNP